MINGDITSRIIEIQDKRALNEDEVYTRCVIGVVISQNASKLLHLIVNMLPLKHFSLNHLKRARKLSDLNMTEVLICPCSYKNEIPIECKELIISFKEIDVTKIIPQTYAEFLSWGSSWPVAFRPSEKLRMANKIMSTEEAQNHIQFLSLTLLDQLSFQKLSATINGCRCNSSCCERCSSKSSSAFGAIMVNEKTKRVVMTSFDAYRYICNKRNLNAAALLNHPLYTSAMLCIEGVAALVRGEQVPIITHQSVETTSSTESKLTPNSGSYWTSDGLNPDPYLCCDLILYAVQEPDIMSSMALVHSRIHSVYFENHDIAYGGLGSRMHVHTLRSLNHHYRAFQIKNQ